MDEWDQEFAEAFQLQKIIEKLMIRRVSFRYIGLIRRHFDLLFDLIRSADETDLRHNSKVIHLQAKLGYGSLSG